MRLIAKDLMQDRDRGCENTTYMYCSVVTNVMGTAPLEEGEGAVKVPEYHWDKNP